MANFYTLVTRDTKDQDFSTNRQLFLTEQGYSYNIVDAIDIVPGLPAKMAELEAELERKKLSGEWDIEAQARKSASRYQSRRGRWRTGRETRRGRKPKAKTGKAPRSAEANEGQRGRRHGGRSRRSTISRSAGARRLAKNAGRDHLRLVK